MYLGRSRDSIKSKVSYMGLTKRMWEDEEIEYLEFAYSDTPIEELMEKLGRTKYAIRTKALQLGLTKHWTDFEVDFLVKNFNKNNFDFLAKKLQRSSGAIRCKVKYIGLNKKEAYIND